MKKSRKLWILGAALFLTPVLGLAALLYLLYLAVQDEPPPADGDLRKYRREVSAAENGFFSVNLMDKDVNWPREDEKVKGGSEQFDLQEAQTLLGTHAEVLKRFDDCLGPADFQIPEVQSFSARMPYLLAWRELSYLVSCRQRFLYESGKEKEALQEALKLIRFGYRIENSQGPLVNYLVGIAIRAIGVQDLRQGLRRTAVGIEDLKPLIEEVGRYPVRARAYQETLKVEYNWLAGALDQAAAGNSQELAGMASGFWSRIGNRKPFLKPQQTKRLLSKDMRRMIENAAKVAGEREEIDFQKKYGRLKGNKSFDFLNNGVGKVMLSFLLPTWWKSVKEKDIAEFYMAALQAELALRCFQKAHGRLPDSLEALVPEFLRAVPLDPYDGKPLKYDPAKQIIYAVGQDLKDSGGSKEPDSEKACYDRDEPTFRIDF